MIDEGTARDLASRWLASHGEVPHPGDLEMVLREFEHGWLVTFRRPLTPGELPPTGGLRLIVDGDDGQVHVFPTGEPPERTTRAYSERKRAAG